jgi:tRNA pseudouridine65 synthase
MNTETPPLEILYEDNHLVVINKPAGLLVHRSPVDRHETRFAVQLLRDQIGKFVYPLHRLDKPTSGVLVFALDKSAATQMSEQIRGHDVSKRYLCVVRGHCPDVGRIDHALREDPDKYARGQHREEPQEAVSLYRCLAQTEIDAAIETYPRSRYSLVEVQPITGRRHQIRRHMKHLSHPIIGDAKHGRGRHNRYFAKELDCPRLLLHAAAINLRHPVSGELLTITAPLDTVFSGLLTRFGWPSAVDTLLSHGPLGEPGS